MLTLNLSCAQPGERHHLNLTTARPFLTLVEIVAAMDFLRVPEGVWDRFLQNMHYQKIPLRFDVNVYAALECLTVDAAQQKSPPYVVSHCDHVTAKTFSRNLRLSDYVMRTQPQEKRRLRAQQTIVQLSKNTRENDYENAR